MNILISLFFSITLAFSVFAEDIKIIELHNQTIDQILLNATSDNDDVNNDINDDVNNDINDDVNNDINDEELTNSSSIIENEDITIINSEESEQNEELSKLFLIFGKMLIKMSCYFYLITC